MRVTKAGAGCGGGTRACKPGTLFLTIDLDDAAAAADQLVIEVSVDMVAPNTATRARSNPGGSETVQIDFPNGYPVDKPVRVQVIARENGLQIGANAIDLDKGEIRWQVPLGTYPALEKRGLPPTGTFNIGGPLVTAGGLVFIGAAMDERFHAFDKATGKLLWEFQMEAGGYATPATFEIAGRQYVIIASGGGGKPETKPGNAYYCFALPEK